MPQECRREQENTEARQSAAKEQSPTATPEAKAKKKKKKKVKVIYTDDGHTVYDMSAVSGKKSAKDKEAGLSRRERRAAMLAGLAYYLPRVLLVLGCFTLVGLLMWLWLR